MHKCRALYDYMYLIDDDSKYLRHCGAWASLLISELLHKRHYSAGVRDDAPNACGVAHVCDHNGHILVERLKSSNRIWCRLQIQPGLYSAIIGGW